MQLDKLIVVDDMTLDFNNLVLLAIGVCTAISAYFNWKTQRDMRQVHIATNSMKDALVKSTADASFAAGRDEARIAGEHTAEVLAAKNEMSPLRSDNSVKVEVINKEPLSVDAPDPLKVHVVDPKKS